jgi:tetratricopeptide (TPR) repeat protein
VLAQVGVSGLPNKTQLEKSRPLIDQAILLDPQSSVAFTALGQWYRISGDIEKAEQAYQQAMVLGPNNVTVLVYYGWLKQWESADPASALKLFRRAVELDPQNTGLAIQLAEIMGYNGLADEAIPLMEGVLKDHPDSAGGFRTLGQLYSTGESRHDKAIRAVRMAYELDPQHPANATLNAFMHWRLGDFPNTALWLNHAARLAPDSEVAPVYRCWTFINERNYDSADRELDRSTAQGDLYWLGIFTLGRVDMVEGRPGDALERYKAFAPRFNGRKSFLNFSYGVAVINAYRKLGEQEKAQALQDELMSVIETNPPLSYHGMEVLDASLYAVSGQVETAITTLEEWVNQGGVSAFLQVQTEYELSVLAGDPRYQELLKTVKNRLDEQRANIARWEASGEMPPMPREVSDPG